MKILLVNDVAAEPGYGDVNHLLFLRDKIREKGHDVRVFATTARSIAGGRLLSDYQCYGAFSHFQTMVKTANISAFLNLRRVLREFQPDVVHVQIFLSQLSPLILPLLQNIPSLHCVVDGQTVCPMGNKILPDDSICQVPAGAACYHNRCLPLRAMPPQMLTLWLWKRWRKSFDLIVTNSEALRRQLIADGIIPAEVIWNSISWRPPRPPLASPPVVAFAGRLVWGKGADLVVSAVAKMVSRVPDIRLIIAGSGPESEALRKMITDQGLAEHVTMTGFIPQADLERLFDSAWVQVAPTRWFEGFGRVAIEAMMRGTAVVAAATGGLTELVQHGRTGFLVTPGDVETLTDSLLTLILDRQKAEKMGRAARDFALEHFDENREADRYLEIYQDLCRSYPLRIEKTI